MKTIKGESPSRVRIPLPPQWFLFLHTLAVSPTVRCYHYIDMRNTQHKGDTATSQCIATFTRKGFDVLIPLTESAAYDLALDTGEKIVRVQVKYSSGKEVDLRNIHSNAKGYVVKKAKKNAYDWLYVLHENGSEYLVQECLEGRRSITFFDKRYLLVK